MNEKKIQRILGALEYREKPRESDKDDVSYVFHNSGVDLIESSRERSDR